MELANHKRKKSRAYLSPPFLSRPPTRTIINQYFTSDIVCQILSYLDQFDLIRSSIVCKSWHDTIHSSHLLTLQYWKRKVDALGLSSVVGTVSESTVSKYLEEIAMKQHELCLQNESHLPLPHPVPPVTTEVLLLRRWWLESCREILLLILIEFQKIYDLPLHIYFFLSEFLVSCKCLAVSCLFYGLLVEAIEFRLCVFSGEKREVKYGSLLN
ncbi:hypothetical protein MKW92_028951, partial [Papaver armeniacum]